MNFTVYGIALATAIVLLFVAYLVADAHKHKHRHSWKVIGVTYQSPDRSLTSLKGAGPELLRQTLFGISTLTQECKDCGLVATSTETGKVNVPGFTWPGAKKAS